MNRVESLVRNLSTRPVRVQAVQFLYYDNPDETRRRAERIESMLGLSFRRSYDPQSGRGYFMEARDGIHMTMIRDRDWILRDSFGKFSVVPDADLAVYYEPKE